MAQINFGGVNETVVTREEFPLEKARKVLENETIAVIGYGVQQFVRSGTVAIIKSRRELLNEYLEEIDRLRAESDEEGSKSEK